MRNLKTLLFIIIIGMLAGCNVHEWPDKRETVSFRLLLNFHPEMGTMDYFYTRGSSRAVGDHDMRYIVRAFPLNTDGSSSTDYTEEFVFTRPTALGDDYNYSTRLELPAGSYRLSVWADFVDAGSTSHKYYDPDDFSTIVLHGDHKANTDYRDAFSGWEDISLEASIYEDVEEVEAVVEMTRPMAKYTFISTDLQEFIDKELLRISRNEGGDEDDKLQSDGGSRVIDLNDYKVMIYYPMYMPNTYNLHTDKATWSATGVMYESKLTRLNNDEASMGFDYVVINDDPDAKVTVKVGLFDNEGNQLAMSESFNIPLKRSVNTLVRGKFLVVDADGGISIDPSFDGDHNIVLP